jgi:hypothetical protein
MHRRKIDILDIQHSAVEWNLPLYLDEMLRRYSADALAMERTAKGNLKNIDRDHLHRCLRYLSARINADLGNWLVSDPRYLQILHERVNETLTELLTPREAA